MFIRSFFDKPTPSFENESKLWMVIFLERVIVTVTLMGRVYMIEYATIIFSYKDQ
jgi:hypothetical protein